MKKIISLVTTFCLLFAITACGKSTAPSAPGNTSGSTPTSTVSSGEETPPATATVADPFRKFETPVQVHVAMPYDPTDTSLAAGNTVPSNFYTKYLKDNYNIDLVVDWYAPFTEYNQKLAISITTNDIPDAFIAPYFYWKEAADAGLLKNLTNVYNDYASDSRKYIYESSDGAALEACMYEGEMLGLANTVVSCDGVNTIMVRQDWLDKLSLEMPTTVDQLYAVLIAFRDAKLAGAKTVPFLGAGNGDSLYTDFTFSTNHWYGFDPIFAAMGSFPGYFVKENDEVTYGSLSQNTRDTYELLSKWYKEGLIDPEIGSRMDPGEIMNGNFAGMFVAPWWSVGYANPSSFYSDENVDWQPCILDNSDGKWAMKEPFLYGQRYLCVSADATDEVAAAAIVTLNVMSAYETQWRTETAENINSFFPLRLVCDVPDTCEYENRELMKILDGKANVEDYVNTPDYPFMYGDAQALSKVIKDYTPGQELRRKNFNISEETGEWQRLYSILVSDRIYANRKPDVTVLSEQYNHSDVTLRYWDNLWNAESAMGLKIITGKEPITSFDAFAEQWSKEGGDEILKSIN